MELEGKRVLVTGGFGFFGKHLLKALDRHGVKADSFHSNEYNLSDYTQACEAFREFQPEIVFHLAAVVGGIGANQRQPAFFWQENLEMGLNVLRLCNQEAFGPKVQKLIMVGSICCYPRVPKTIPFIEEELFTGYPEETNAPYAIAKLALITGAQAYRRQYGMNAISLLPTNLYGPGDHFSLENSHVIPALIRKIVTAKEGGDPWVMLWGTGKASRCFLYAEDAAEGMALAAKHYDGEGPVNLGSSDSISIKELAEIISEIVGYKGEFRWDTGKPDGQPLRAVNTEKAERLFGFKAKTPLREGLKKTIEWYLEVRGE